jgi:hypothetical protein
MEVIFVNQVLLLILSLSAIKLGTILAFDFLHEVLGNHSSGYLQTMCRILPEIVQVKDSEILFASIVIIDLGGCDIIILIIIRVACRGSRLIPYVA